MVIDKIYQLQYNWLRNCHFFCQIFCYFFLFDNRQFFQGGNLLPQIEKKSQKLVFYTKFLSKRAMRKKIKQNLLRKVNKFTKFSNFPSLNVLEALGAH